MNSIILNLIYLTLICFLINILFITVSYKLLIQFILIYFCIFIFLLYLEVNFLALSFFIVYIGAVAILFLFTVLLLGKTQNNEHDLKEQKFFFNFKSFVWKDFISSNSIFLFYKFNTNWANSFLLQKESTKLTLLINDNSNFILKNLVENYTFSNYEEKNWYAWQVFYGPTHFFNVTEVFLKSLSFCEFKELESWKNKNEIESLFSEVENIFFNNGITLKNFNISDFKIISHYLNLKVDEFLFSCINDMRKKDEHFSIWETLIYNPLFNYMDDNPFRHTNLTYFIRNSAISSIWNLKESSFNFISKNLKFGFLNDIYILSYNLYETYFLLFWLSGCLLLISMLTVVSLIVTPKK